MGLDERGKLEVPVRESSIDPRSGVLGPVSSSEPSEEFEAYGSPRIIPCFNGKSIEIHEELVVNGLSAISIKHHKGKCKDEKRFSQETNSVKVKSSQDELESEENQTEVKKLVELCYQECPKISSGVPECLKGKMKRRNSFWNIHRPELSKLTWPENFVSSAVLQDFFHNHMRIHGTFCEPLHDFSSQFSVMDKEYQDYSKLREIVPPRVLPPDEKVVTIMEKSRSVQLNDEDLEPQTMVHKSRAEFCVTIGEYIRRPLIKRTMSQQIPKYRVHPANRFESLPLEHESLLSKEAIFSEEKVSAAVGNTGIALRRASPTNTRRLVAMSPASLSNFREHRRSQEAESGEDSTGLRTILSPRDDSAEETTSWC